MNENGTHSRDNNNREPEPPAIPSELEKIFQSYEIYKDGIGWQRDYVYYDITPSNLRGTFKSNYKEYLCAFTMMGDPMGCYNKISDQTGDPKLNYKHKHTLSPRNAEIVGGNPWTDGEFESIVKINYGTKHPTGNEFITTFRAKPDELFFILYKNNKGWYTVDGIDKCLRKKLDIPLFSWDIENYSSIIKISIEEIDSTETYTNSTTTTEFATNFEFNFTTGNTDKIGMKFGASLKDTRTTTFTKTMTVGNDELGEVLINFGDPVLYAGKYVDLYTGPHRANDFNPPFVNHTSGQWYSIEVSPKKWY